MSVPIIAGAGEAHMTTHLNKGMYVKEVDLAVTMHRTKKLKTKNSQSCAFLLS